MSLEFNTRVDYKYQGGDTVFSVPFSYINKSHIIVVVNGDAENPVTDFTWLSENQIRIDSEINTGDIVSVRRITPIDDKMVVFEDNNILDEETQNLAQDQVFNVVQEIKDASDNLNANMSDFVNLKNTIDSQLEIISEAGNLVNDAYNTFEDTHNLVQGISETYEEMKAQIEAGLPVNVMQNLFTLTISDRALSEDKSLGLAAQGSTQTSETYPDAYQTLATEYMEGESKIFQSEDTVSYSQAMSGEVTGDFFIPSGTELAQGVQIYSDEDCVTVLDTVEVYNNIKAFKYNGTVTEELYTPDTELDLGVSVYSDKTLTNSLGTVEDIQKVKVDKFTLTNTGEVYKPVEALLSEGTVLYKDPICTEEAGQITFLSTIKTDKYYINHIDFNCFYVPEGTEITVGTEIFADPSLSTSLGKIKTKGTYTSNTYYYYKSTKFQPVPFSSGCGSFQVASIVGAYNWVKYQYPTLYYYTKEPISTKEIPIYVDAQCTKEGNCNVLNINGRICFRPKSGGIGTCEKTTLQKKVTGDVSYNYISLETDDETVKYEFYKQAVVTSEVLQLNTKDTYEDYKFSGTIDDFFIKITDTAYQLLNKTEELSTITIKLTGAENSEIVTSKGIVTSTGIVFEYREHPNGHKIVDSRYKNVYINLNPNEFYLLNTEDKTFTVPILDNTKHIYFCVGNVKIYHAEIGTITHNEFYKELARCIKHEDVELLEEMSVVIENYDNNLQQIQEALGIAEGLTEDIIEEL